MNAIVLLKAEDGSFAGIYVDKRGQVEAGVGEMLYYNYTDVDSITELIDMGDAVILNESIEDSVFKERDNGEDFKTIDLLDDEDFESFVENVPPDFVYIFENDAWKYAEIDGSGIIEWNDLEDLF